MFNVSWPDFTSATVTERPIAVAIGIMIHELKSRIKRHLPAIQIKGLNELIVMYPINNYLIILLYLIVVSLVIERANVAGTTLLPPACEKHREHLRGVFLPALNSCEGAQQSRGS